ncbi:hypothetical protein B484DRAFT_401547, partial [Ochromonadaceae sp. CCMP2298]
MVQVLAFLLLALCALCAGYTPPPMRAPALAPSALAQKPMRLPQPSKQLSQVEDDGYGTHRWRQLRSLWRQPGQLILVRHGETAMNYNKTFTGWIDTDLSEIGVKEIEHAANLLMEK